MLAEVLDQRIDVKTTRAQPPDAESASRSIVVAVYPLHELDEGARPTGTKFDEDFSRRRFVTVDYRGCRRSLAGCRSDDPKNRGYRDEYSNRLE